MESNTIRVFNTNSQHPFYEIKNSVVTVNGPIFGARVNKLIKFATASIKNLPSHIVEVVVDCVEGRTVHDRAYNVTFNSLECQTTSIKNIVIDDRGNLDVCYG